MAILLVFYKVLLERESMHTFKRIFLLSALIFSFITPAIIFTEYVEPIVLSTPQIPITTELSEFAAEPTSITRPTDMNVVNWPMLFWTIYCLGLIGFGFRFFRNLFQIFHRIKANPKFKENLSIKVLLKENLPPHTFFSYIFLNKTKFESNSIPQAVLTHEETHAKEHHSLDVLIIELLQVLFWFNPFIYFFKKSIKLNHEFLADSAVLKKENNTSDYQNTLLSYLSKESLEKYQSTGIANAINYSSIKKRFTVMKKRTSKKTALWKSSILLPLCSILLFAFSQKKVEERSLDEPSEITGNWLREENELDLFTILKRKNNLFKGYDNRNVYNIEKQGDTYFYTSPSEPTKKTVLLDEEKGIIQFAGEKYIRKNKSLRQKLYGTWLDRKNDVKIFIYEYDIYMVWDLTEQNKKTNSYYPKKRGDEYYFTYGYEDWSFKLENGTMYDSRGNRYTKINQPNKPSAKQIKEWQNESEYALWLDGKIVDNSFLDSFNKEALFHYQSSYVYENARSQKFPQPYQVHIYTENGYTELNKGSQILININSKGQILLNDNLVEFTDFEKELEKIISQSRVTPSKISTTLQHEEDSPKKVLDKAINIIDKHLNKENIDIKENFRNNESILSDQEAIEYNRLAKKYNAVPIEKRIIPMDDLKVLETIYRNMTDEQKQNAQPFPECLPQNQKRVELVEININNKGQLLVQDDLVRLEDLKTYLSKLNEHLSYDERKKVVRSIIKVDTKTPKEVIQKVDKILTEYGCATINIVGRDNQPQSKVQHSATREEMKEYNTLAKKYNDMDRNHMYIKKGEVSRLKVIYGKMSEKQRADAEPFPDFPPPPPTPDAPKPPKNVSDTDYAANQIRKTIDTQDPYDIVGGNIGLNKQPVQPLALNYYVKEIKSTSPTPPPPPKSPLEYVKEMAGKGATFIHNGKKISAEKAIELIQNNNKINIDVRGNNGKEPIVKLSTAPIQIED